MANRSVIYKEVRTDVEVEISYDDVIEFLEECTPNERAQILTSCSAPNGPKGIVVRTLDDELRFRIVSELYNTKTLTELELLTNPRP